MPMNIVKTVSATWMEIMMKGFIRDDKSFFVYFIHFVAKYLPIYNIKYILLVFYTKKFYY